MYMCIYMHIYMYVYIYTGTSAGPLSSELVPPIYMYSGNPGCPGRYVQERVGILREYVFERFLRRHSDVPITRPVCV